ncbi:MAG: acyl-CoA dehydrogenase family protein [Actinobacteria bacterium]|nr:acyl-CoA dehydrogenase family protein [Actinomycetota bacterium]MBU4240230.1 acyl-CoA dehydrogenase family protein [Actinomycetota bacterium]MBU4302647.1 acyl-CoA dehydrogenase family protein [Actinomycetota bacterium]MBU4490197.1 acyl-CoA dehydrogenase family protein [Actinomycetota bacterium]MCG2795986.1 acyl-CoA dehydrogenase family protein [Actinomycetes bacterium]
MPEGDPLLKDVRKRVLGDFPALQEIRRRRPLYVEKLVKTVRDCAEYNQRYAAPAALELDWRMEQDHDYFAWDLVKAGLQYRFLSLAIPGMVEGVGGLTVMFALAMEEMCSTCAGIANIFGAHALGISPLLVSGALAQWETVLREVARKEKEGEPVLMAAAITEPSAGTDAEEPHFLAKARLSMNASKVPGGYVLNGRKCFISNGSVATYTMVACALDRERPLETWTSFLVHRDMEGFSVPRVEEKMGQRACPAAELLFEDCFVPDENVLGFEGDGMQPGTLLILAASRAPVAAIGTGIARGAYEWFLRWARRGKGGRAPIDEQRVQMALADMKTRVSLARWAYFNAALSFDATLGKVLSGVPMKAIGLLPRSVRTSEGMQRVYLSRAAKRGVEGIVAAYITSEEVTKALANSSLAKAVGGDTAMYVSSMALEMMGADQGEERVWVEKFFRDAKLTQIYEGTNQLNRLTVFMSDVDDSLRVELKPFIGRGPGKGAK